MKRPLLLYVALAYGISWGLAALAHIMGIAYGEGALSMVFAALFMLGPALAAVLVRRYVERAPLMDLGLSLRDTNWRWMGITALIGLSLVPLTLLFNHILGAVLGFDGFGRTAVTTEMLIHNLGSILADKGVDGSPAMLDQLVDRGLGGPTILLLLLLAGFVSAITVNLPFMFGEEFGWRGMMHHHLQDQSFGKQVLMTGICWGLWHAPMIVQGHNYPEHPVTGIFVMTLFTVLLSVPFAWLRIRSRSVWGPVLLHGLINGTAGGVVLFTDGAHVLLGSIAGLSGMLAIATATVLLVILDPGPRRGLGPINR